MQGNKTPAIDALALLGVVRAMTDTFDKIMKFNFKSDQCWEIKPCH